MIHPVDYEALERMFRDSELPADLCEEYEIQRLMASAYGHSGPLGMGIVIPMMRFMGYGKLIEVERKNVDWRRHIGEDVLAQYGDGVRTGDLVGLGSNGCLVINIPGYGEVEMPRYCVKLKPITELDTENNPWLRVKRGTRVVVHTHDGPVEGKLTAANSRGIRVKLGLEEIVCSPESVELSV